jgi:class 3 adenylate cyclase
LTNGDRILLGRSELVFHGAAKSAPVKVRAASDTQMVTMPAIRQELAWMVLADIEGFTPFSQNHPPDEVSRRVGGWLSACATIMTGQQADIQVFLGDGFLAYFPLRTFPAARFFAVLSGLQQLQADPVHLPFRLVVHHDRITVGAAVVGGIESVLGAGVNYLFRMEKIAGAARVRYAATPAALAAWPDPKPKATSLGRHSLKGFEGRHELFSLA